MRELLEDIQELILGGIHESFKKESYSHRILNFRFYQGIAEDISEEFRGKFPEIILLKISE